VDGGLPADRDVASVDREDAGIAAWSGSPGPNASAWEEAKLHQLTREVRWKVERIEHALLPLLEVGERSGLFVVENGYQLV